jgi:DNA polymerase I-like protein with 3'-5' exonuclease and polymerase domains/uracil-DNA glycosylase
MEEDQPVKEDQPEIPVPGADSPLCQKCGFYKLCQGPFQGPAWVAEDGTVKAGMPPEEATPEDGWIAIVGDAPDTLADEAGDIRRGESLDFLGRLAHRTLGLGGRAVYFPTLRCAPRKILEGKLHEAKPTKTELARCFDNFTRPLIKALKPRGVVASGYLASNRVVGRMDFQNLTGRTYTMDGATARAVWSVDYLKRDTAGQKAEYMRIWRDAVERIDHPDLQEVWSDTIAYDLITTPEQFSAWLKPVIANIRERTAEGLPVVPLAWDLETSSLHVFQKGYYAGIVSFDHPPSQPNPSVVLLDHPRSDSIYRRENPDDPREWPEVFEAIKAIMKKVLQARAIPKTGHNLQYDEGGIFAEYGYECDGFYADTMLLNFILHPDEKGLNTLDDMCRKLLPQIPHYWERLYEYRVEHQVDNYMDLPEEVLFPYSAYDTRVTSLILAELEPLLDRSPGGWFIRTADTPETPTYSIRQYAIHGRSVHHKLCGHLQRFGQHYDADLVQRIYSHYDAQRKQWKEDLSKDPDLVRFESEHLGPNAGESTEAHQMWKKWRESGMLRQMDESLDARRREFLVEKEAYTAEAKAWRTRRDAWAKGALAGVVHNIRQKGKDVTAETSKLLRQKVKRVYGNKVEAEPEKPVPIRVLDFKKAFKNAFKRPEGTMPDHLRPPISWSSVPQQKMFFLDFLGLPVLKKTETGGACLDADVLLKYSNAPHGNETAKKLLKWRGIDKFIVSFLDPILNSANTDPGKKIVHDDGLIHCQFGSGDVTTGRLSSKRPNMQAIPRDGLVKKIYGSRHKRPGWIFTRDYSGLEVRILALVSRDEGLLHSFLTGGDPHFDITQKHFFGDLADAKDKGQRSICKRSLFGNIYGQGDQGLLDILTAEGVLSPATGEPVTLDECKEFNEMLYDALPGVGEWVKLAHQQGKDHFWSGSAFGFVRPLPALKSFRAMKSKQAGMSWEERQGNRRLRMLEMDIAKDMRRSQNMPIQSTASDLTVFAAYWINEQFKKLSMGTRVFNVVHDDIWSDVPCDDEVETVARIYYDTMDRVTDWLPELLPGYDPSWIDIPIIGEGELGVNPKDALGVVEEPSVHFPERSLKLTIGLNDDTESTFQVLSKDGEKGSAIIPFAGNESAIKEYLMLKRQVF